MTQDERLQRAWLALYGWRVGMERQPLGLGKGELERAHRDLDVLDDCELFFRLVRESMEALHLEDADIAGKMPASRLAVSRWRRGLNAPLPMARGNVLKFFMKRVRRALRQQEQAREDGEK